MAPARESGTAAKKPRPGAETQLRALGPGFQPLSLHPPLWPQVETTVSAPIQPSSGHRNPFSSGEGSPRPRVTSECESLPWPRAGKAQGPGLACQTQACAWSGMVMWPNHSHHSC